jgi:hypothetical protein
MDDEKNFPETVVRPASPIDEKTSRASVGSHGETYHPQHAAAHTADLALLEGDRINLEEVDPKELRRVRWKIDLAM